jgi:hypothetical protein
VKRLAVPLTQGLLGSAKTTSKRSRRYEKYDFASSNANAERGSVSAGSFMGMKTSEPSTISGSISMVTSRSSVGLVSIAVADMPEPCPMLAAVRAPGRCASASMGARTWVVKSEPSATGYSGSVSLRSASQRASSDASGFPFVASAISRLLEVQMGGDGRRPPVGVEEPDAVTGAGSSPRR